MSAPRPIWYEPTPVAPERKAELRAAGYQVMDLWQAPPGWKPPVADAVFPNPELPENIETLDVPEFLKKSGKVKRGD